MKRIISILALLACLGLGATEKSKIQASNGTLAPEERLETDKNYVRSDTDLKVRVEFKTFQPFAFGRGNDKQYRSEWFEISESEVVFYDMNNIKKNVEENGIVPILGMWDGIKAQTQDLFK